ncbi:MAG: hypothetical protein HYY50_02585 [Candidatus Kerfeldbacteria bacterium]|nr:hypothetical protein [Candidatus Kerfeldbacteria bacterium]
MDISIVIPEFANPFAALWWAFTHGGFIIVIIALGYGFWWIYLQAIQIRFLTRRRYVLLAIDVPKENEQTPKAVEHIFSHFSGIYRQANLVEKYVHGYVQLAISVELVSLGGYIQYLVRCPAEHRDLVEAAIYAQYPEAEISEVEDYAFQVAPKFPNDEYDVWASELELTNKEAYPIRTYPLWEHPLTQTFLDPMAALLEVLARLREGEQIWLQWVIRPPANDRWRERGLDLINKLIGAKVKPKRGALDVLVDTPSNVLIGTYETITRTLFEPTSVTQRQENGPPSLMQHLAPNVRAVVEGIGIKISKTGFQTKGRFVYLGRKDVFDRTRVNAIFGALRQFASMDMNGFKPDKKMKTKRNYFRVEQREAVLKRRIILGYRDRSLWAGRSTYVLNIEELASVWHFPVRTVKAPLVKKTEAKRGEPPSALPLGQLPERPATPTMSSPGPAIAPGPTRGAAPENLPVA